MKFKAVLLVILVSVLILSCTLAGCVRGVVGSGNLTTEEMNFSDFTKLDVSHAFRVEVTQGNAYRVVIRLDDNLAKYLRVNKVGNTLDIGLDWILPTLGPMTLEAEVTMPSLESIDLSGACRGTATWFRSSSGLKIDVSGASQLELVDVSAGDVDIDASGASKVTGDLKASGVRMDASGASTVQLEGTGDDVIAEASGASRMKLAGFTVNDAKVNFSGASSGTVNVSGTLDVDLSGASKLTYLGEPRMGSIDISGGSNLSNK